MKRIALIPIRDFRGLTRLAGVFNDRTRGELGRRLAGLSVVAAAGAGCMPTVLTADPEVAGWASALGIEVQADSGTSLTSAVGVAVADLDDWMILHADLPLVTAEAIGVVVDAAAATGVAIAPSMDGGTNVLAGHGPFAFSYGPGSFAKHLARCSDARVVIDRRLAIELDTPAHAVALSTIGALSSLDL